MEPPAGPADASGASGAPESTGNPEAPDHRPGTLGLNEVPPAERGATRVADQVIAKLAARAAREALPGAPAMPHATASVRRHPGADGSGGMAHVRVSVELRYPSDIGAQCRAVRRRITRRLGELAGMEVTDVAVDVERLHSEHMLRGAAERRVT
ncbi:hypothetical protein [Streptomyces sp. YIM 98790]|uniref:hypothetical protein n=1 Tax=Streptomyces sp. YIM 98790 TaxID=2689077 RepID=UPI00140CAE4D